MGNSWEGLARWVLEETGFDEGPVDAFELATALGVDVYSSGRRNACLSGNTIYVRADMRPTRVHGSIAHELGHWLLREYGEENTEQGAQYLAGALMLPRNAFLRDVAKLGCNLLEHAQRHPNVSFEMLAWRLAQVAGATGSVWDFGKLKYSIGGHETHACIASRALEEEEPLNENGTYAVPILEPRWRRVVVSSARTCSTQSA